MILSNKYNGVPPPEYSKQIKWVKKFAWFPTKVDDGRIVWWEYVMTVTRTMKYPEGWNVYQYIQSQRYDESNIQK